MSRAGNTGQQYRDHRRIPLPNFNRHHAAHGKPYQYKPFIFIYALRQSKCIILQRFILHWFYPIQINRFKSLGQLYMPEGPAVRPEAADEVGFHA